MIVTPDLDQPSYVAGRSFAALRPSRSVVEFGPVRRSASHVRRLDGQANPRGNPDVNEADG
jgi:hypothetical protein